MTTEAIAKETASQATKSFLARTEAIWGTAIDSVIEKFRDGVQAYLDLQQEKFLWTKTFLHHDPVYFYDVYQALKISHRDEVKGTNKFEDVFKIGSRIAFIGQAGSGKSTLMRHLFLNIIQKGEYEIPLFIELRRVTQKLPLLEYIENHALGGKLVITKMGLRKLFDEGKTVLFLDGFDEIAPECFSDVVQGIDDIVTNYPKVKILATGRPGSRVELLRGFECARMTKLEPSDIRHFIQKQKLDAATESKIIAVVNKISRSHKNYLSDYLSNPLILSLFILTCNTTKQLPETRSAFYRRVIDTLFVEHDSITKPDYDRQLRSGLSQVRFEKLLQRFSAVSFFQAKYEWDFPYITNTFNQLFSKSPELRGDESNLIRDLVVSVGLWSEDCGIYAFSHRSLQEYFAAEFIVGLESKKKEEVYVRLSQRLKEGKTAVAQNFLSLCRELDEQAYLRYFLIPTLAAFRSKYDRTPPAESYATLMQNHISRFIVFSEDATRNKPRPGANPRRSLFGRIGWQYLNESDLHPISQVYPEPLKNILFQFVFEGALDTLIGSHTGHPTNLGDRGTGYDMQKTFSHQGIARAIVSNPKSAGVFREFIEFVRSEEAAASKRLSELHFADATLISDLI